MSREPLLPIDNDSLEKFIVVRFSDESIEDLELNITNVPYENVNTKWLRNMCRNRRYESTNRRRLKFIRNGVIVNLNSNIGQDLSRFFQNVGSDSSTTNNKFYLHCMVGTDILSDQELANEDQLDAQGQGEDSTTTQAIGFDRLRLVGFSDEDIALFREQFRRTYGDLQNMDSDSNDVDNSDDNNVDLRQLEEEWMETGVNGSPAGGDNIGTATEGNVFNSISTANYQHNIDILLGLTVGFSLGLFGLLLMKLDKMFNRTQKVAIVGGVVLNMIFNMVVKFN